MSIFTALAAIVVLAASAATADAQSVSFSITEATVKEGAPDAQRLKVTVTRSGSVGTVTLVGNPAFNNFSNGRASIGHGGLDELNIRVTAVPALTGSSPTPTINFDTRTNQAVLTIYQDPDGRTVSGRNTRNFFDETAIFALRAAAGTKIGPPLNLTFDDAQLQPTVEFSKTSIRLTEGSVADGRLQIRLEDGSILARASSRPSDPYLASFVANSLPIATNGQHRIRIKVEPPDGIGTPAAPRSGPIEFKNNGRAIGTVQDSIIQVNGMPGVWSLPPSAGMMNDTSPSNIAYENFTVEALPDKAGFRNTMVTITLLEVPLEAVIVNRWRYKGILKGSKTPLVIEVISDEQVPTVYFSPTDISIKEGGSTTAALVSEGKQGAEVNAVKLAVDGAAMVDLYKGDTKLEPKDGVITVDLKDTNLARLTARSTSDRSLLDGQMKSKTWRITDADGANIDSDANSFTVTVEGSTAVPALPLLAQLLLALFLAAGGARFYRRRS